MNKITKLFALAVLSVMANPTAIFADYSSSSGSNAYGHQTPTYQYQDNPSMSGDRSSMKGSEDQSMRMRQDSRNMYPQGYDPSESYSGYPGHDNRYPQQYSHEGYYQGGRDSGNYMGAPQSYPIDDNAPTSQTYRPNQYGPSSHNEQHPQGSYDIGRVNPNDHHPVYEYRLGKDGKWHNTAESAQAESNTTHDYSNYELGYNTQKNTDSTANQNPNDPNAADKPNPSTLRRGTSDSKKGSYYQ